MLTTGCGVYECHLRSRRIQVDAPEIAATHVLVDTDFGELTKIEKEIDQEHTQADCANQHDEQVHFALCGT